MIKKSESAAKAKEALQAKYGFSDPQVKAILDMRLAKLANLERVEIQNEYDTKQKEIEKLTMICQNPDPELIKLFTELKNKYGDARRTTITYIEPPKEEEVFIEPEKCVVVMSKDGLIKRIPTSSFKTQKRNGKGVKTEGDITSAIIRTNTVDSLMVFTNKGKMYRLVVDQIPEGTNTSKGQSIKSLIAMDIDEEPSLIYSLYKQEEQPKYILFVTQNGIVKKTALAEYVDVKRKSGIAAIKLREGDSLVAVQLVNDEDVILLTHNGYAVRFNSLGIISSSRVTVGVKGITLNEGDYIVSALCCRDTNDSLGIFSSVGTGKKISLEEIPTQSRGGKGLIVYKCGSNNGYIVGGALISDEDSLLIIGMNSSIFISAADVPLMGRAATGNSLIKGTSVQAVSKV
jgi:DNA gyrase subunit A